jgi:hypothetical protein
MAPPPRLPPSDTPEGAPLPRTTQADREALVRQEWREGDIHHNLAVAALAGMSFEQARELAVAATPDERSLL